MSRLYHKRTRRSNSYWLRITLFLFLIFAIIIYFALSALLNRLPKIEYAINSLTPTPSSGFYEPPLVSFVIAQEALLHSSMDPESEVIAHLVKDTSVLLLEYNEQWVKIQTTTSENISGWGLRIAFAMNDPKPAPAATGSTPTHTPSPPMVTTLQMTPPLTATQTVTLPIPGTPTVAQTSQMTATPSPALPTPPTLIPPPGLTPTPSILADAVVQASTLKLRNGPDEHSTDAGEVQQNAILKVLGKTQDCRWLHVVTLDGTMKGWVPIEAVTLNVNCGQILGVPSPSTPDALDVQTPQSRPQGAEISRVNPATGPSSSDQSSSLSSDASSETQSEAKADLAVSAFTIRNIADNTITFDYTIANQGAIPVSMTTQSQPLGIAVHVFLSDSQGNELYQGQTLYPPALKGLAPGQVFSYSYPGTFPNAARFNPTGTLHLTLVVDAENVVSEVNENNNQLTSLALPITPTPTLQPSNTSTSTVTPTNISPPTQTPVPTPTYTPWFTSTPLPTVVTVPTPTPLVSLTNPPIPTFTNTATATSTSTSTPTATASNTPVVTPTATSTPLNLPTPTVTATVYQPAQSPEMFYNELQMIYLVNLKRREQGLAPLRWNRELNQSARWFAYDSVEQRTGVYCGHEDTLGRTPGDRILTFNYTNAQAWGENVVCGFTSPEKAVNGLMNSAGHKQNIINPIFREIGVGYYYLQNTRGYIVQDFAYDPGYAPLIINNEAITTTVAEVQLYIYNPSFESDSITGMGDAIEMMVSNDATFANASWEPFIQEKQWILPLNEGWHTVYVQTRDAQGRTALASDAIYLGASVPLDTLNLSQASSAEERSGVDDTFVIDSSNFEVVSGNAGEISDVEAVGGIALQITVGHVRYWTTEFYKNVEFTAYIKLKVSDNQSTEAVLSLNIDGGGTTYGPLVLKGTDFVQSNKYQEFSLPFIFHEKSENPYLIFNMLNTGRSTVFIDTITVKSP